MQGPKESMEMRMRLISIKYPMHIRPLSKEEGGGYLIEFPDLPGCIADGETVEQALIEAEDALKAWISSAKADGYSVPLPYSHKMYSGQFRLRVPRSMHAKLAARAKEEEVSLNTIAIALLAEGLTRKQTNLPEID